MKEPETLREWITASARGGDSLRQMQADEKTMRANGGWPAHWGSAAAEVNRMALQGVLRVEGDRVVLVAPKEEPKQKSLF